MVNPANVWCERSSSLRSISPCGSLCQGTNGCWCTLCSTGCCGLCWVELEASQGRANVPWWHSLVANHWTLQLLCSAQYFEVIQIGCKRQTQQNEDPGRWLLSCSCRFRTTSNSTTDTFKSARRRAEEYLAGSSVSQTSQTNQTKVSNPPQEDRRKAPTASPGGSGARAWHQGLARQKAEVEASVQDYRRLLLKSLKTLSQVAWCKNLDKSWSLGSLLNFNVPKLKNASFREVMMLISFLGLRGEICPLWCRWALNASWKRGRGDALRSQILKALESAKHMAHHGPYSVFLYGYFTCLNCNVFLTATSTFKKRKRVLFITWKVPRVHRRLATGQSSNHLRFGIFWIRSFKAILVRLQACSPKLKRFQGSFRAGNWIQRMIFDQQNRFHIPPKTRGGYPRRFCVQEARVHQEP